MTFESKGIKIHYKNSNIFRFLGEDRPETIEVVKLEFDLNSEDYIDLVEIAMNEFISSNSDKLIIFNKNGINNNNPNGMMFCLKSRREHYFSYVLNKVFSIIDVIDYNILCCNRLDFSRPAMPQQQNIHNAYVYTSTDIKVVIVINECLGRMLTTFRKHVYHDVINYGYSNIEGYTYEEEPQITIERVNLDDPNTNNSNNIAAKKKGNNNKN